MLFMENATEIELGMDVRGCRALRDELPGTSALAARQVRDAIRAGYVPPQQVQQQKPYSNAVRNFLATGTENARKEEEPPAGLWRAIKAWVGPEIPTQQPMLPRHIAVTLAAANTLQPSPFVSTALASDGGFHGITGTNMEGVVASDSSSIGSIGSMVGCSEKSGASDCSDGDAFALEAAPVASPRVAGANEALMHSMRASSGSMSMSQAGSTASTNSVGLASVDEVYTSWQPNYVHATTRLQACLVSGANDAQLKEAIAEVYGALHGVVALRRAALHQGKLEEVQMGVFFSPDQRLLLWLGGLRPTDLVSCARIKMSAMGEILRPEVAQEVDTLQAACRNRQAILARGIEELSEKLSRATAVAQYVTGQLATRKGTRRARYPASILGIRESMAQMYMQADELRSRLLEQLAVILEPRQLALVLMAPLDMMASPVF